MVSFMPHPFPLADGNEFKFEFRPRMCLMNYVFMLQPYVITVRIRREYCTFRLRVYLVLHNHNH